MPEMPSVSRDADGMGADYVSDQQQHALKSSQQIAVASSLQTR
ncbi:MAG: hypothetical protein WBF33_09465 [Candidatus Nitrosopolaris sp.]